MLYSRKDKEHCGKGQSGKASWKRWQAEVGWTKEERKASHCKGNSISKGQEVRYDVVAVCMVLGSREETLFHRKDANILLAP